MSKVLEALTDDNYRPIPQAHSISTHVTNHFCNGHCSRCGDCCGAGPLPITRKEEKKIRRYIKEHNVEYQPSELHVAVGKPNKLDEDLRCCFYDAKNKRCLIYDARPEICRSFRCNMTLEQIEANKIRCHERAYWNHMTSLGINKDVRLTNFAILFYDKYYDLLKWIMANLKPGNFIALADVDTNEVFNKALKIMELGGIDVPKIIAKIEQEAREDANRHNHFSISDSNNNIS